MHEVLDISRLLTANSVKEAAPFIQRQTFQQKDYGA